MTGQPSNNQTPEELMNVTENGEIEDAEFFGDPVPDMLNAWNILMEVDNGKNETHFKHGEEGRETEEFRGVKEEVVEMEKDVMEEERWIIKEEILEVGEECIVASQDVSYEEEGADVKEEYVDVKEEYVNVKEEYVDANEKNTNIDEEWSESEAKWKELKKEWGEIIDKKEEMDIPGPEKLLPRKVIVLPRTETVQPRIYKVLPQIDSVQLGKEKVLPKTITVQTRTVKVQPKTDNVQPRTDIVQSMTDIVQSIADKEQPRKEKVQPITERVQPRTEKVQLSADKLQPAAKKVKLQPKEKQRQSVVMQDHAYVLDSSIPSNIKKQICHSAVKSKMDADQQVNEERMEGFSMDEPFEWGPKGTWKGEREKFCPQEVGPTIQFRNGYEAINAIWSDMMYYIVRATNRNAQWHAAQRPGFATEWFETNVHEIWCLFAFWIMLGIIKMPSIKSCFTNISLLRTDIFRQLFSENRYNNLNTAFHLTEINLSRPFGPIEGHLNKKFQEYYLLNQEVCVGQYMIYGKKPDGVQYGVKTCQVREASSGYLWSLYIFDGRTEATTNVPSSAFVVFKMVHQLLDLGHTFYLDSWCNSPILARWLKRRSTDCVGTVCASKKHIPPKVQRKPLSNGQYIVQASDTVMVVALQDRVGKRVTYLTTYEEVSEVLNKAKAGRSQSNVSGDFNYGFGGIDRVDQVLDAYLDEGKRKIKWNLKIFKLLLDFTIENARILVGECNTKSRCVAFRLALVQEIINKHLPLVPIAPNPQALNSSFPPNRLKERHFIRKIINISFRSNWSSRQCVWCKERQDKVSRTNFECVECQLPLCNPDCFREFHTVP